MSMERLIKDVQHIADCCYQGSSWAQILREAVDKLRTHPDAQPNEPKGDGWISVEDRLPDVGVPVLIHNPHWDLGVGANYVGYGIWKDTWCHRMTYTPTHWRPLPEPPKEEHHEETP